MKRLFLLFLAAAAAQPAQGQVSEQPASAVVPVVSSSSGLSGANFRTELQMTNPTERAMTGWLLLRPHGIAARYDLQPHATKSWADFVGEIGGSDAGSLDLLVDSGDLPTVAVRSYDDQPAGTNGVTVPLVPIESVLQSGDVAALIAPRDPANFRFNIGVRALGNGAEIEFVVRDAGGTERRRVSIGFDEHEFDQKPAGLIVGTDLGSGDSIEVTIVSGAAVVYGSTVDNRTNDAALQVLRRR